MRIFTLVLMLMLPLLAAAGPWVMEPVHVIDVECGEVLANRSVRFEKNRIAVIGEAGQPRAAGMEVVDGKNGYLIPGLAEMHAHVPGQNQGDAHLQNVLDLFLANGVTTIRGMLGQPSHLQLRAELASGARRGPRLVTSGPSFNGNSVTSPQQAVAKVREQKSAGYDFLKIHPGLSREEFVAIAQAANDNGIPFAGHVSFQTGLETALAMHQATIDHLDSYAEAMVPADSALSGTAPQWFGVNLGGAMDPGMAPQLASATASAGVWNVFTQSLFETTAGADSLEYLLSRPGMDMASPALIERWTQSLNQLRERSPADDRRNFLASRHALIAALQDAGAGIVLGSDAPQIMNVPGYSLHQEMEYMVAAGMTPLEVLQSGTVAAAQFFGFENAGLVREGYAADVVLLQSNPLEDISNSSSVIGVVRNGQWFDRQALNTLLDRVREAGL